MQVNFLVDLYENFDIEDQFADHISNFINVFFKTFKEQKHCKGLHKNVIYKSR